MKIKNRNNSKCYTDPHGNKLWRDQKNRLHREDGPAAEWTDGFKEWWLNGQRHRKNGPAIERPNGTKEWWAHGQLHREDGPAVEYAGGLKGWWLFDVQYIEKEYWTKIYEMGLITKEDLFLKLL